MESNFPSTEFFYVVDDNNGINDIEDVAVSKLKNTFDTPQPRYPTGTIMTDTGKTKIKVLLSYGIKRNGHDCIWSSS